MTVAHGLADSAPGLSDLAVVVPIVSGETPLADIDRMFGLDRHLGAVIVATGGGPLILPRDHLQFELAGPFGYGRSLYHRATAFDLARPDTLVLPEDLALVEAAGRILQRPLGHRYEDPIVAGSDGPRVVPVSAVFERVASLFAHAAMHDVLTGLPNRRMLVERAAGMVGRPEASGEVAILYVDLDGFKAVNDTFGHLAGDAILVEFAGRLRTSVRPGDLVARIGGDEFAVLLDDTTEVQAHAIAERIVLTSRAPFVHENEGLYVSATVGLAMSQDVLSEAALSPVDVMLRHADGAMLAAKAAGKRQVGRLGTSGTGASATGSAFARAARIRRNLRDALNHNTLSLHYQPKLDLRTGTTDEVEALLRWTDPDLGSVSPAELIPIAERSGQIHRIGRWVLDEACAQIQRWDSAGTPRAVAVNVSATDFATDNFIVDTLAAINRHGIDPARLRIEITEGSALARLDRAVRQLAILRDHGICVDLDDFGTGYSSLAMLRRLPVAAVKIDRSFITGIDTDRANALLIDGVIAAAHELSITVIAEGVERIEELNTLRNLECDAVQGFYIARPAPPDELAPPLTDPGTTGPAHIRSA